MQHQQRIKSEGSEVQPEQKKVTNYFKTVSNTAATAATTGPQEHQGPITATAAAAATEKYRSPKGNQMEPQGVSGSLESGRPETTTNTKEPDPTQEGRDSVGGGRGRKRKGSDLETEQPPSQKRLKDRTRTQKEKELWGKEREQHR